MIGALVKALYIHYTGRIRVGKPWIIYGNPWNAPDDETGFVSVDKENYYIFNKIDRPNYACIPFNLFIEDEYYK